MTSWSAKTGELISEFVSGNVMVNISLILAFLFCSGENERIQGVGHGNQINGMCSVGNYVYTCGIDDSVKQIDVASKSYTGVEMKLGSQPRGMGLKGDTIVAASVKEVG